MWVYLSSLYGKPILCEMNYTFFRIISLNYILNYINGKNILWQVADSHGIHSVPFVLHNGLLRWQHATLISLLFIYSI